MNEAAHAACDGSKKDYLFSGNYIITYAGRSQSLRKKYKSNGWELNNFNATKGCPFVMSFEMIYVIGFKSRKEKAVACMDNKNLIKHMKEERTKPSEHAQDCSPIKIPFDQVNNS